MRDRLTTRVVVVSLSVIVAGATGGGCRSGGAAGTPCRDNSDCAPGLFCSPRGFVCDPIPVGSDAGGGGGTDAIVVQGTDAAPGTDAAEATDAGPECGNGIVETGEQCDPTAVACDGTCQISASACAAGVGVLMCGSVVMGANDMAGSTSIADGYGPACMNMGVLNETGPEVAYVFLPATNVRVTFTLDDIFEDLDLAVLVGSPACDSSTCIEGEGHGGTDFEDVTIDVLAWQPVFVVVDGYMGATSSFTLSVACGDG